MKNRLRFILLFVVLLLVVLTIPSFASYAEGDTSYIDGLLNSTPLYPRATGVEGLDRYINEIIAQCGPNASPAEKLKHCFNFIINNTAYGYVDNGYTAIDTSSYCYAQYDNAADRTYISQALTVLMHHTGVCNDYSSTFVVMARAIGFDAYKASGYINTKSGSRNGHEWAFINLNGTKFIFDPQAQQNSMSPNFFYGRTYDFTRCYEELGSYTFGGFNMTSPVFSAEFYAQTNPDVAAALGTDYQALYRHFITFGIYEGRLPSPAFDVDAYYYYNPDIRAAYGSDPRAAYYHYLTNGIFGVEFRRASYIFYVKEYASLNPDVEQAFTQSYYSNPSQTYVAYNKCLKHFLENGINEKRMFSYGFNMSYYMDNNEDLRKVYGNNVNMIALHAERCGMREGRKTSPIWHGTYYLNRYADIKAAYGNDSIAALNHYMSFVLNKDCRFNSSGCNIENRRGSEDFNRATYWANYSDLKFLYITDLVRHYLVHGIGEGRIANRIIDTSWAKGDSYYSGAGYGYIAP